MAQNNCRGCGQFAGAGHRCATHLAPHVAPAATKAAALMQARREFSPSVRKPSMVTRVMHAIQWSYSEKHMRKERAARIARAQEALGTETN